MNDYFWQPAEQPPDRNSTVAAHTSASLSDSQLLTFFIVSQGRMLAWANGSGSVRRRLLLATLAVGASCIHCTSKGFCPV